MSHYCEIMMVTIILVLLGWCKILVEIFESTGKYKKM